MKPKEVLLLLSALFTVCGCGHKAIGAPVKSARSTNKQIGGVNGNYNWDNFVTLSQLKSDDAFASFRTVKIEDDGLAESVIRNYEHETVADSDGYNFTDCALFAFQTWCHHFCGKDYDYDVYQLQYKNVIDQDMQVWHIRGERSNSFDERGSIVSYDPYIEDITINKALQSGKIVMALRELIDAPSAQVAVVAIIPFEGEYYKCQNTYYFREELDCSQSELKNTIADIGNSFPEYVDADGWVNKSFFDKYFRWSFGWMDDHQIQRAQINPDTDTITLKSVFY